MPGDIIGDVRKRSQFNRLGRQQKPWPALVAGSEQAIREVRVGLMEHEDRVAPKAVNHSPIGIQRKEFAPEICNIHEQGSSIWASFALRFPFII
jgi:hypothetical protein